MRQGGVSFPSMSRKLSLPLTLDRAKKPTTDAVRKRLGGRASTEPGAGEIVALRTEGGSERVGVVLFARGEDVDRIVGLELGADDYLPKPFNSRELIARVRAILRRTRPSHDTPRMQVGDVTVDPSARQAWRDDRPLSLTMAEFVLLDDLLRHAGQVLSREHLAEQVLGRRLSSFDRSIDVHVSNLRKKLGDTAGAREHIRAVRGEGYVFVRLETDRE